MKFSFLIDLFYFFHLAYHQAPNYAQRS